MPLRAYQQKVLNKMVWARQLPGNDLVSLCQSAGKSHIIAELAHQLQESVLVLVPNKELLVQNLEKLEMVTKTSVYSASLGRKEIGNITIGTIQSVCKNPSAFSGVKVVIIDECDGYPIGKEGMYSKTFKAMGIEKIYGLTATPFRLDTFFRNPNGWKGYTGSIRQRMNLESVTCTRMINRFKTKTGKQFWTRMLAVINTHELQEAGYLSTLTYRDVSRIDHSMIPTNKTKSDFDLQAFDQLFDEYDKYANMIEGLDHERVLVFCSSIEQANELQQRIKGSVVVTSETTAKERKQAVERFKSGEVRVLLGVMIFIAGFDVPSLDCIVSLRPTRSLRIWSQLLGRGTRKAEGKETCTVYDLVGNIKSMGTLESMKIVKLNEEWDVITSAYPSGMNGKELYSFKLKNNMALIRQKEQYEII